MWKQILYCIEVAGIQRRLSDLDPVTVKNVINIDDLDVYLLPSRNSRIRLWGIAASGPVINDLRVNCRNSQKHHYDGDEEKQAVNSGHGISL
jgi:hypothetical protein